MVIAATSLVHLDEQHDGFIHLLFIIECTMVIASMPLLPFLTTTEQFVNSGGTGNRRSVLLLSDWWGDRT
jgi:hypothetical protein